MESKYNDLITKDERSGQQGLAPTSVKNRIISADVIRNSSLYTSSPVSVANGKVLIVTATYVSAVNSKLIIGGLPFMIAFYDGSVAAANLIPDTSIGSYSYKGPVPLPNSAGGSDGNNLVYKTYLSNSSGMTKNIIVTTQLRFLSGIGQTVTQTVTTSVV